MQSLQPTSALPPYIVDQARDDFELIEARKRGDILGELHGDLEIIDRDDDLAHALQLMVSIAPGKEHCARYGRCLVPEIQADAVLVFARATNPRGLDRRAQTCGGFRYGR